MEVYADLVFLVNWCMDFLILWAVGKIVRKKVHIFRLALASFFMSLSYCLMIFVTTFQNYSNIIVSLLIIIPGIYFAFKPINLKEFFFAVLSSYASAFALGGMSMAFFYFMNTGIPDITGKYLQHFSFRILLASTAGFYILLKLVLRRIGRMAIKKQTFFPVRIYYAQQFVSLNALVDTGNSLYDPLSNVPVIIAEFGSVKDFLPEKLRLLFYENKEDCLQDILSQTQPSSFSMRLRLIPFSSLGKQNGMLLGFRPDKVEITREKDILTIQDVVIGIYNSRLSGDGGYQGLLNPEVISPDAWPSSAA